MEHGRSRILIVGDSSLSTAMARSVLEELGFGPADLHEASGGEAGLGLARRFDFALVISDWEMPDMNGLALLQAMRAEEKTRHTPFLMITDDENRLRVSEAARAGATGFLPRPYTPRDLSEKIRPFFQGGAAASNIDWERFPPRLRPM